MLHKICYEIVMFTLLFSYHHFQFTLYLLLVCFFFFFFLILFVSTQKKKNWIFFFCYVDIFKFVSLLNFVLFNFINNHPKKNSRSYHGWLWPFIKLLGYVLGRFSFSSSTLTSLVLLEIGWALRWWWVSCSSHLWWDLVSWFPSRFSY